MAIYGTALLSLCLLGGLIVGNMIGMMVGVDANVGGVGIAMLLLIVICNRLQARGWMAKPTQNGVFFWSSVYIPIIVAMAASQNVRGALSGGTVAVVAGIVVVVASFAMVPLVSRISRTEDSGVDSFLESASTGDDA
jgi:malonate transporter MadL subunit